MWKADWSWKSGTCGCVPKEMRRLSQAWLVVFFSPAIVLVKYMVNMGGFPCKHVWLRAQGNAKAVAGVASRIF